MYYTSIKLTSNERDVTKKSILNNIIRSILYTKLQGYGVKKIIIHKNTSLYENVYITDRIEQIPFKSAGEYTLEVSNSKIVYTNSFSPAGCYPDIAIVHQATEFDFHVEVKVVKNVGIIHNKYCPIQLVRYNQENDLIITMLDYIDKQTIKQVLISLI